MCHMPLGVPAGDMSLAHPRGSRRAAFQGGRASEWASRETRRLPSRLGAGKPGSLRALGRRTGGPQGGGHPPTPPSPPPGGSQGVGLRDGELGARVLGCGQPPSRGKPGTSVTSSAVVPVLCTGTNPVLRSVLTLHAG